MDPNIPQSNTVPLASPPAPITPVAPINVATAAPQNTSGQGKNSVVPEEIKGWSWGGSLWTWIWAIGNKTWIGLLGLIGPINLIMAIVLGVKGREWAWKNKHWDSVEAFIKTQRNWAKWWLIINLPLIVLAILGILASAVLVAVNPISQMARANDAVMRSDLGNVLTASDTYYANNASFPWETGSVPIQGYSSTSPFTQSWFNKLSASGLIPQSLYQKLSTSKYKVMLITTDISSIPYVYYCYLPQSDINIRLAATNCQSITDVNLLKACQPGSEYLCVPDLKI